MIVYNQDDVMLLNQWAGEYFLTACLQQKVYEWVQMVTIVYGPNDCGTRKNL